MCIQKHQCPGCEDRAKPPQAHSPRLGSGKWGLEEWCCLCPTAAHQLSRHPLARAAPGTHSSGLIQHQLLDRADDRGGGRGHGSSKCGPPQQGTRPRPRLQQPPDCPQKTQREGTRSSQEKHLLGPKAKDTDNLLQLRCFRIPTPHLQARPAPDAAGRGWRIYHREVM